MECWIDRTGPDLRGILQEALEKAGYADQAEFLREYACDPDPVGGAEKGARRSRQAYHARLARVRANAAVAAVFLCGHDDRFHDALLAKETVWLRTLCAETQSRVLHAAHLYNANDPSGYLRLFDRARSLFLQLCRDLDRRSLPETLQVHCALAVMFFNAAVFGERVAERWRELYGEAERSGLLDNPHLRMQLSLLGSYVGDCSAHLEWLLDERNLSTELGDVFCYVRKDWGDPLFETQARLIRGELLDPSECLYPKRPLSTLRHLADYVLSCMRSPGHFNNEGMTLMVLTWIQNLRDRLERLEREGAATEELRTLKERLRRIDHVQVMEKGRFFQMLDRIPPGPARSRLEALWHARFYP